VSSGDRYSVNVGVGTQVNPVNRIATLVGQVEMAVAVGGDMPTSDWVSFRIGCGAWKCQELREVCPLVLSKARRESRVRDIQDLIHNGHAFRGMEGHVSAGHPR
jgi:hypothetical protein